VTGMSGSEGDRIAARWIVLAIITAIVVRGIGWLASALIFGPVLGVASFQLRDAGIWKDGPWVVETTLWGLSTVAAVWIAVGVGRDGRRWRRPARILGWVVVADTAFYLSSIVIALVAWDGWPNLWEQRGLIALYTVLNVPLFWLGLSIGRRSDRPSEVPAGGGGPTPA
jgi:hypothetical protein